MRIGVRIPHTGPHASPELVREWCGVAEVLGFATLWGVDHVVMPRHSRSLYDLGRQPVPIGEDAVSHLLSPNFEVVATLAFVAAVTRRIKLATSVQVLTIRNPVLNARQLATVDRFSDGRLLCGVGAGWLKEEADAMGLPWDRRGERLDESIALLRALWSERGPHVEFHGEFWDVAPMDPEPRPVQQPIPIIVGGHSDAAIDRAARLGDGWVAAPMYAERLGGFLPALHEAARRHGRDPGSLAVYGACAGADPSLALVRQYEALGIRELQLQFGTLDALRAFGERSLPLLVEGSGAR
jgi:probable F420-dependent oxidoreductase